MVLDHARTGIGSEQVPIVCLLARKHRPLVLDAFGRRADDVIWGDPDPDELIARLRTRIERPPIPRSRLVHDPVTGALTSEAFEDQLRKEHERVNRGGRARLPRLHRLRRAARVDGPPRVESARRVARTSGATDQAGRPQARLRRMASRHGRDPAAVDPDQGCPDSFRSARAQDLPPGVRDRRICDSPHAGHRLHRDGRRRHPGGVRRPGLGCDEIPVGPARSAPDALGRGDVDEAGEHVDDEALVRADPNAVPDRQPAGRRPRRFRSRSTCCSGGWGSTSRARCTSPSWSHSRSQPSAS